MNAKPWVTALVVLACLAAPARAVENCYDLWRSTTADFATAEKVAQWIQGTSFTDSVPSSTQKYYYWLQGVETQTVYSSSQFPNSSADTWFTCPTLAQPEVPFSIKTKVSLEPSGLPLAQTGTLHNSVLAVSPTSPVDDPVLDSWEVPELSFGTSIASWEWSRSVSLAADAQLYFSSELERTSPVPAESLPLSPTGPLSITVGEVSSPAPTGFGMTRQGAQVNLYWNPAQGNTVPSRMLDASPPKYGGFSINSWAVVVGLADTTPEQARARMNALQPTLAAGRNDGDWTGPNGGVYSAWVQQQNASKGFECVGIGMIANADLMELGCDPYFQFETRELQEPCDGYYFIKPTYAGDANLDGLIDQTDFDLFEVGRRITQGTSQGRINWLTGDFNYDGAVDDEDRGMLERSYESQGEPIRSPQTLWLSWLEIQSSRWTGGATGDPNWTTTANWGGGNALVGGDLQFGPAATGAAGVASGSGLDDVDCYNNLRPGAQFHSITFASGAPAYHMDGNAIKLNGPLTNSSAHDQTISMPLEILSGGGAFDTGASDVTLTGAVSGVGPLVKAGAGTLVLAGPGTYAGGTTVCEGTLLVASVNSLPSGGALMIGARAVVVLQSGMTTASTGDATSGAEPSAVSAVPEPATTAMFAAAAATLLLYCAMRNGTRCVPN